MCVVLKREKKYSRFKQERIFHVCSYYYRTTTTPSPVRRLYGRLLTLYIMYCFLYSGNLGIIKYTKLTTFFMFLIPPPRTNSQLRHCRKLKLVVECDVEDI